ncbi:hypothetical protein AKJ18_04750 [Vibrio xuii]|nr:hypothetical protein AKJ18_04750 [Vibrio xuii]
MKDCTDYKLPTVSVVIPTYNNDSNLRTLLSSMTSVEYSGLEVIVVDGAVSSTTQDLVKEFGVVTKLISEADSGIYDAMNKGILCSSGDFVCFLGDDDRFNSPDVLKNIFMREDIEWSSVDLIVGDTLYDNGTFLKGSFGKGLFFKQTLCHQSLLYKRELLTQLLYDVSYKITADYKLNLQLYKSKVSHLKYEGVISFCGAEGLSSQGLASGYIEESRASKEVLGYPVCLLTFISGFTRFTYKNLKSRVF